MKGYCDFCGKEVNLKIEPRSETYSVKGEPITVDVQVCVCSECNEDIWVPAYDDENLRKAYNVYRNNHGLLLPAQIKKIRDKYGLSQTAFAKVLGFGEKTIARYENGSIQDEVPNNLLMLVDRAENFMKLFEKNKDKLTKEERWQVEGKLRVEYGVSEMDYTIGMLSSPHYSFPDNVIKYRPKGESGEVVA